MLVRNVYLHGILGERFGKCHRLAVQTPAEAVKALSLMIPGFRQEVSAHYWKVSRVTPKSQIDLSDNEIQLNLGQADLHIAPVVVGAGGAIGRAIFGAVLIAGAFLLAGPAGMSVAIPYTAGLLTYGNIALFGVSLLLSGVLEMTAPHPKLSSGQSDRGPFFFSQQENVTTQGGPVPLVYGWCRVGSVVVSAGITTARKVPSTSSLATTQELFGSSSSAGSGAGGGKTGSSSSSSALDKPNTLESYASISLIDVISEGVCGGLANGLKSVYLNDTAIQNADGTYNFKNMVVDQRLGEPDQDYLPGFPDSEAEESVGVEATKDTPVVRTITDTNLDSIRFTLRIPAIYNTANTATGMSSVKIAIDRQADGGTYEEVITDTIKGKSTSTYDRQYDIPLEGNGPWNIRLRRLSADSTDVNQNKTIWSSYTKIIDQRLSYMNTALIAIKGDAEAFGGAVPKRTYDWVGIEVETPSNRDPNTRAYSGVWDGTFVRATTDNVAWIVWDLITNNRYGLGEFVQASETDKWVLYTIGQYCDELVDDGFGGLEPRFTFNAAISNADEAWKVIQTVASMMRAMMYWGPGMITFSADMPADPVMPVSQANVVDGLINYSGTALKSRHSVVQATWFNPELGYIADVEIVEDRDLIERFGRRVLEVALLGCTSRGQARRMGLWALDTEKTSTDTGNWEGSFEQAQLRPGDIVEVFDPGYAGLRRSGRIADVILNGSDECEAIVVDNPVTFNAGSAYTLIVMLADGTRASRSITNSPGLSTTITFDPVLVVPPQKGGIWGISGSVITARQFRVVGVKEVDTNRFGVTALLHDPLKYARIEQGIILDSPSFTALPSGPIKAPASISVSEDLVLLGGAAVTQRVTISWTAPQDTRVTRFAVDYLNADDVWVAVGTSNSTSLETYNIGSGTFQFRVRSVSIAGAVSTWTTSSALALSGLEEAPEDVQNLRIIVLGDQATLSWTAVTDLNLEYYIVRFSPVLTGASWETSSILIPQVLSTQTPIPVLSGTFFVKAVTRQGHESANAAEVVSNITGSRNVVETVEEHPNWLGNKTDVVVGTSDELRLDFSDDIGDWPHLEDVTELAFGVGGGVSEGLYEIDAPIDLSEVYVSKVIASIRVEGEDINDTIISWTTLDSVLQMSGVSPNDWGIRLEMRTTSDDPLDTGATWSEWQEFRVGDYQVRGYDFRLYLFSYRTAVTPVVVELTITIDMPDRVYGEDGLTISTAGRRINFSPAFKAVQGKSFIPRDFASGDHPVLSNEDNTGFDIVIKDSTNTPVERIISYVAKGYGQVQGT